MYFASIICFFSLYGRCYLLRTTNQVHKQSLLVLRSCIENFRITINIFLILFWCLDRHRQSPHRQVLIKFTNMFVTYGDNFMKEHTHKSSELAVGYSSLRLCSFKFIFVFTNIRWFIACPRLLHWIFGGSSNYPFITYQANLSASVLSKIGCIK